MTPSGVEDFPYATVISDKCMPGFKTCMSIIQPAFDTLEEAFNDVVARSRLRLVEMFAELDGGNNALDTEPPITSFGKLMLTGSGPVNATVIS